MTYGVNMLKADPRLWVPVDNNYKGFAYKPSKGWLSNANSKVSDKYIRLTTQEESTIHSLSPTTVNAR